MDFHTYTCPFPNTYYSLNISSATASPMKLNFFLLPLSLFPGIKPILQSLIWPSLSLYIVVLNQDLKQTPEIVEGDDCILPAEVPLCVCVYFFYEYQVWFFLHGMTVCYLLRYFCVCLCVYLSFFEQILVVIFHAMN